MSDNTDVPSQIKDLGQFHIDSFNFVIHNINKMCPDIDPVYAANCVKISVSNVVMKEFQFPMDTRKHKRKVYPSEAKLRAITYYAQLGVQLCFQKENVTEYHTREFYVPCMVKSDVCYLHDLDNSALISVKEDFNDPGGYFIINGNERLFRHFIVPKRNYPITLAKSKWKMLRKNYSEYGTLIRSVKDEHIFKTISIHLLNDGSFEVRLFYNLTSYYIQLMLILKALVDKTDALIVKEVIKYYKEFPTFKLKNMLHALHEKKVYSHDDAKQFLGKKIHSFFKLSREISYSDAVDYFFRKSLLVHLDENEDKFQFLCFSLCKLHCASIQQSRLEDLDNPVYQEILSSGQIYLLIVKEGIITYLKSVRNVVERKEKSKSFSVHKDTLKKCCNVAVSMTPHVGTMMATGNFPGRKYGLRSETGFTVALKRTNVIELASQLTKICKFSVPYFLKDSRSFYPESWGFLCPTQTPESENVGLYNYLSSQCKVVNLTSARIKEEVLFGLGVVPCNDPSIYSSQQMYPVIVDGKMSGWISCVLVGKLLYKLRKLRSSNSDKIPYHLEIVFISKDQHLFPGIYLFSSSCRLVRKLFNQQTLKEEFIGVFEQVFLTHMQSFIPDGFEYKEVNNASFLGLSTRMIPFLEHNFAVRNIYASEV